MVNVPNVKNASTWGPIYNITAEKGQIVLDAAKAAGHEVDRVYGYNTTPDHNNRQCIDFMHYGNDALRLWLENYLEDNKATLGVEGIISVRRVKGFPSQGSMYRGPEGQWRTYYGPNPHTDHVHAQFNTNPVAGKPKAKAKGPKRYKLYLLKKTTAYNKAGKPVRTYPAGKGFTGTIAHNPFGDGRYLVVWKVPHRLWLPLDNHNFSHSKGGPSLQDD